MVKTELATDKGEQTRSGICSKALDLLPEHGFDATTMQGIASHAGGIHALDRIRAVECFITTPSLSGPANLASPNSLPNREFIPMLRKARGARVGLASTEWMLEIGAFLLRMESELVLKSRRVVPGRLPGAGSAFNHPTWEQAAEDLLDRGRRLTT